MKQVEALEIVRFGPGTVLQLNEKQAAARTRVLKPRGDGVYEALDHVEFKRGEIIGLEGNVPKVMRDSVKVDGRSIVPEKPEPPTGPVKFVMPAARDIPKDAPKKKRA